MGDKRRTAGGADLTEQGVFSLVWKHSESLSLMVLREMVDGELMPIKVEDDRRMIC